MITNDVDKAVNELVTEKLSAEAPARCKRCGWELSKDPLEPSESDTLAFLKTVLSNKPFEKKYELFGGKVKAILRSRTVAETDSMFKQLEVDRVDGKFNINPALFIGYLNRYQLAISLVRVYSEIDGETTELYTESLTKSETKLTDLDKFLGTTLQDTVFTTLLGIQRDFESLISILTARASDANFWKTVG